MPSVTRLVYSTTDWISLATTTSLTLGVNQHGPLRANTAATGTRNVFDAPPGGWSFGRATNVAAYWNSQHASNVFAATAWSHKPTHLVYFSGLCRKG